MAKKSGLGKGLGALIREMPTEPSENIRIVEITRIAARPDQPRKSFDKAALEDLAKSIEMHGILQPLILREEGDGFELIAGERRLRAAQLAGLTEVPVIIKSVNDATVKEISIIENIQREDLNPIEEALAYKSLMEEFQLTQEALAAKVGKSRSYVANALRLLNLDDLTKTYLMEGALTSSQGRTLLSITDLKKRKEYLDRLLNRKANIREIERLAKGRKKLQRDIYLQEMEEQLGDSLATKVRLVTKKKGGRIEIDYYDEEDLERLCEILKEV